MAMIRPQSGQVGVLIVDADPSQRRTLARMIAETSDRYVATAFASRDEAAAAMRDQANTVIIADLDTIGGISNLGTVAPGRGPLIATSTNASLANAVAAMRGGAADFLPKPIGARSLIERLDAAVSSWREPAAAAASPVAGAAKTVCDFAGFIGRSGVMRRVYEQIQRVAPSRAPVFITGESGTGKELCAEAVHGYADGKRPFIAINCSAIPRDLMESEIFGHVRGAFTGASESRTGAAALADGGTLFLDEIAEMDLALQAKLLRFVQTGTIRRVGGSSLDHVDARIICATNRDPLAEVEAGRFRADLYYRLHVLPIELPTLRDRGEDVLLIARALLGRFAAEEGRSFAGFDDEAERLIATYAWPGNVRQLANVVRRIVVLHDGGTVDAAMLPAFVRRGLGAELAAPKAAISEPAGISPFRDQERKIIEAAIRSYSGNVSRAAAALEISPATIYRKLKSWGIPEHG